MTERGEENLSPNLEMFADTMLILMLKIYQIMYTQNKYRTFYRLSSICIFFLFIYFFNIYFELTKLVIFINMNYFID